MKNKILNIAVTKKKLYVLQFLFYSYDRMKREGVFVVIHLHITRVFFNCFLDALKSKTMG